MVWLSHYSRDNYRSQGTTCRGAMQGTLYLLTVFILYVTSAGASTSAPPLPSWPVSSPLETAAISTAHCRRQNILVTHRASRVVLYVFLAFSVENFVRGTMKCAHVATL